MPDGKQSKPAPPELFFVHLTIALIAGLSGVGSLLAILVPIVWTGFQAMAWLRHGSWKSQPVFLDWICSVSDSICSAVRHPQAWSGVAKLFRGVLDVPVGMGLELAPGICTAR
jgi:hypothetical protein